MAERAQTEVLGYVLVFSIIILAVAFVMTAGQSGLQDTRDAQQTANLEEGFAVLAGNVDDIVREGVPSRATELDLSGQRVGLGRPVTVRMSAQYTSNGSTAFNVSQSIRPLVYHAESGAELVYVNGAVIARGQAGGVTMLRHPRLLLSNETAIIPVVNTSFDRKQLRARDEVVDRESRLLVRAERSDRRSLNTTAATVNLTIEITSPRATAWQTYFETEHGATCNLNGQTVVCHYSTEGATIVITRVAISLE